MKQEHKTCSSQQFSQQLFSPSCYRQIHCLRFFVVDFLCLKILSISIFLFSVVPFFPKDWGRKEIKVFCTIYLFLWPYLVLCQPWTWKEYIFVKLYIFYQRIHILHIFYLYCKYSKITCFHWSLWDKENFWKISLHFSFMVRMIC